MEEAWAISRTPPAIFSLAEFLALHLRSSDQAWVVTTICKASLFLATQHPANTGSLGVLERQLPGQDGSQPPDVATEPWKRAVRLHRDI